MSEIKTMFDQAIFDSGLSDRQRAVLRASLTLFAEKGFERTTTGDIARLANVSEGTVYKRFKTKDQILSAVMMPIIQQVIPALADQFAAAAQEGSSLSFQELIRSVIRDRLSFAQDNRCEVRVFFREVIHRQDLMELLGAQYAQVVLGPASEVVKRYQARRELVDWPVLEVIRYVVGVMLSYILVNVVASDLALDIDGAADRASRFLALGLRPEDSGAAREA